MKVCGAILTQAYLSTIIIIVADDPIITRSLLGTTRITKIVMLVAGAIQYARNQISFYHCIALSNLLMLLTVPDINDFRYLSLRNRNQLWYLDGASLLSIISSTFHVILLIPLVLLGLPLWLQDAWCLGSDATDPFPESAERISTWKGCRLFMANYMVVIECLLIINTIYPPHPQTVRNYNIDMVETHQSTGSSGRLYHFTRVEKMDFLIRGLFLAAVLTISLEVTVSWLNVVASQRDRDWSFGQVVALASVLLAVAFQFGEYLFSAGSDGTLIPRYQGGLSQRMYFS
jgi:hypothetical protein